MPLVIAEKPRRFGCYDQQRKELFCVSFDNYRQSQPIEADRGEQNSDQAAIVHNPSNGA